MAHNYSILEYFGEQKGSKCGYCKNESSYNSFGMWSVQIQCEDYQRLINRNWRRSGHYIYKPNSIKTCCSMYTIKSDVLDFKLNKSHKKVIKRMNKFLKDGIHDKNPQSKESNSESCNEASELFSKRSKNKIDGQSLTNALPTSRSQNDDESGTSSTDCKPKNDMPKCDKTEFKEVAKNENAVVDIDKPNCKKAKLMRIERSKKKLSQKGVSLEHCQPVKSLEKSLEDFLSEEEPNGAYKLKVKLVLSSEAYSEDTMNLYYKYQTVIHNDAPEKITKKSLERFLLNSPLKIELVSVDDDDMEATIGQSFKLFEKYEKNVHKSTENAMKDYKDFLVKSPLKRLKNQKTPPQGYGSFHQQYYLNDKLIAVGVIDVLPQCVSSVYFYYDPDYSFLSLGTYASLREIAFTRQLMKICPSLSSYYLGYYIPTCPKMRYKGKITPSYLLCPEAFTFHIMDEKLSNLIDSVKYMKINDTGKDDDLLDKDDLGKVLVIANRTVCKYAAYRLMTQSLNQNDEEEVTEYANKVGKTLSQTMLLYRC